MMVTRKALFVFSFVFMMAAFPAHSADVELPKPIDWKSFIDQLGNDPESDVGEQMC